MSLSLAKVIAAREKELANLKIMSDRYPQAEYVKGRLYEVDAFRPEDKPTHIVFENHEVIPCVVIGDPDDGGIFLITISGLRFKPATIVALLFKRNPEIVLRIFD